MEDYYILVMIASVLVVFGAFIPLMKKGRVDRFKKMTFPPEWKEILQDEVPFYNRLGHMKQQSLREKLLVFIGDTDFIGLQGFEINDRVKVIIGAQACLLNLGKSHKHYDKLKEVCVMEKDNRVSDTDVDESGVYTDGDFSVQGVSTSGGSVILSWESVLRGLKFENDGKNVVFHEFAHELDREDGNAGGVPVMDKSAYKNWGRVIFKEYQSLVDLAMRGGKPVIDTYGAKNPAEFFAVSTEIFFEKPEKLRKKHPELFAELVKFYSIDPFMLH